MQIEAHCTWSTLMMADTTWVFTVSTCILSTEPFVYLLRSYTVQQNNRQAQCYQLDFNTYSSNEGGKPLQKRSH